EHLSEMAPPQPGAATGGRSANISVRESRIGQASRLPSVEPDPQAGKTPALLSAPAQEALRAPPQPLELMPGIQKLGLSLTVALGGEQVSGAFWTMDPCPGLTVYFVEQDRFFGRKELYGVAGADYPDNAERFIFFSKAVQRLATGLAWKPEVLHLHDWQAGP